MIQSIFQSRTLKPSNLFEVVRKISLIYAPALTGGRSVWHHGHVDLNIGAFSDIWREIRRVRRLRREGIAPTPSVSENSRLSNILVRRSSTMRHCCPRPIVQPT